MRKIPPGRSRGIARDVDGVRHAIAYTGATPRTTLGIEEVHQPGSKSQPGQHRPTIVKHHFDLPRSIELRGASIT
jgi:hypothetical protein